MQCLDVGVVYMENNELNVGQDRSLVYDFKGELVRVFLINGTILSGYIDRIEGNRALVRDDRSGKKAMVNLDHVISISRLSN